MKTKIILVVLLVILSYIGIGYLVSDKLDEKDTIMEGYKRRDSVRDSTLAAKEAAMADMRDEINLLIIEKETHRIKYRGLITTIESLTRPVVTDEVIAESLSWVKHYNDSLSSPASRQYSRLDSVRRR